MFHITDLRAQEEYSKTWVLDSDLGDSEVPSYTSSKVSELYSKCEMPKYAEILLACNGSTHIQHEPSNTLVYSAIHSVGCSDKSAFKI